MTYTLELVARITALDDFSRKSLLCYLAGFAPEAVEAALDEMDRQGKLSSSCSPSA